MKPIPYFEIIKQAFSIAWKNKFLWVFGLLASLGSGMSNMNWSSSRTPEGNGEQADKIINYAQNHLELIIGIAIAMFVLMIIFFFLRILGNAGLIKASSNIAVYGQSTIKGIFSETKKYFWTLVLVEIIIGLMMLMVVFIMIIPIAYLFMLKSYVLGAVSLVGAILIIIPLAVLACFIRKYSFFHIVIGNMKIKMALEYSYVLFKKNIKESLLMGVIAIAINMVAIIPVFAGVLVVALLFAPFGLIAYLMFAKAGAIAVLIVGGIVGVAILLLFSSAYMTFIQTAWVLFFQHIALEKKEEKEAAEKMTAEEKIPEPEVV